MDVECRGKGPDRPFSHPTKERPGQVGALHRQNCTWRYPPARILRETNIEACALDGGASWHDPLCWSFRLTAGQTDFSPGPTWIGVELLGEVGKNDGSIQGKRYFECDPGHGIFTTAPKLKILRSLLQATLFLPWIDICAMQCYSRAVHPNIMLS